MKEFKYVITDAQGIHARPASELVKECFRTFNEGYLVDILSQRGCVRWKTSGVHSFFTS